MPKEELSETQIAAILKSDYGIHVIPKRPFTIPLVTRDTLEGKVKTRREEPMLKYAQQLEYFLLMQATDDIFGSDHTARVAAIGEIITRFEKTGRNILQSYCTDNQFRVTILSIVPLALNQMASRLRNPLEQKFEMLAETTRRLIMGADTKIPYTDIGDTEEKLKIVYAVEDAALTALQSLADSSTLPEPFA